MTELKKLTDLAPLVGVHKSVLNDWAKLPDFPPVTDRVSNGRGVNVRRYDLAAVRSWVVERRAKVLPGRKPQPRGE